MSDYIITERANIVAIADAARNKTGSSSGLTLNGIIEGINSISGSGTTINLDEEITTQENTIASQDTLIADIVSALEGKAAGGGSGSITRTINIDSSEDMEQISSITYISDGKITGAMCYAVNTIEADYGIVIFETGDTSVWDNTFLNLTPYKYYNGPYVLVATQDNGTIYAISSGDQQ